MNTTEINHDISHAEWKIMRIIWTLGEAKSSEIITILKRQTDWQDSTIKTLLGRLVKKEIVGSTKDGRAFIYFPKIQEQDMMQESAFEIFNNFCAMKKGNILEELIEQQELSKDDLQKIANIAKQKITTAPEMVNCDCI